MSLLLTGLIIIIAAGIFQGSFAVPMAYARTWKWENSWMLYIILGMIVFNLIFAYITVPNLFGIYASSGMAVLITPLIFGVLIGFAAITFGLGIAAAGFSLGFAIMQGLATGLGAFIPMVVLHPAEILTSKGVFVLIALAISLTGVAIIGFAGVRKEREQGGVAGEITKTTNLTIKKGIVICVINGFLATSFNLGFAFSDKLMNVAASSGASPYWAGNAVWGVLFTVGGIINVLYCLFLMKRNNTGKEYKNPGFLKNFILITVMSIIWIASFVMYGSGATMMGSWGTVIGWPVYMILSISCANIWGIIQGEWGGNVTPQTKRFMGIGLASLLVAILLLGYSATIPV
ncbi:L-rhamnose/proton symporter RhaT [Candidatus Latescibacterota bacterium]